MLRFLNRRTYSEPTELRISSEHGDVASHQLAAVLVELADDHSDGSLLLSVSTSLSLCITVVVVLRMAMRLFTGMEEEEEQEESESLGISCLKYTIPYVVVVSSGADVRLLTKMQSSGLRERVSYKSMKRDGHFLEGE